MARMLHKLGHTCHIAEDGVVAIEKVQDSIAKGRPYDLIMMDISMPRMDGVECTERLCAWFHRERQLSRQRREFFPIPIILGLTAHAMISEQQRCIDAGIRFVCHKPLSMKALETALNRWGVIGKKENEEFKQMLIQSGELMPTTQ